MSEPPLDIRAFDAGVLMGVLGTVMFFGAVAAIWACVGRRR